MIESPDLQKYSGVYYDSRQVQPGSIFVCIRGEHSDGHDYISAALEAGAELIIVDQDFDQSALANSQPSMNLQAVTDTRAELARVSALYYGEPSKQINVIGITGTNGKTTITHIVQELLDDCALLGTMGLKLKAQDDYKDLGNTTPQSTEVQKILAELVEQKYKYLTMEVSSHALQQKRVAEIKFKTSVIINLTQDHLDYHVTMDNYFRAKAKIMEMTTGAVILNADDSYYSRFKEIASTSGLAMTDPKGHCEAQPTQSQIISIGIQNPADLQATNIDFDDEGLSFDLSYKQNLFNQKSTLTNINKQTVNRTWRINSKLNGMFNVYNLLAAIAIALEEGLSIEEIQSKIQNIPAIAGRFEMIKQNDSPYCIVDYAHSPDGLQNILKGARALLDIKKKQDPSYKGKLVCIFGCGGDRDITKRPKMGKIAYELSDYAYVTSDNPRSEDPEQIIADILSGIPDLKNIQVLPDRAQAIAQALKNASEQDIVVLAGKGHENYQILSTGTIHFDDREQILQNIGHNT